MAAGPYNPELTDFGLFAGGKITQASRGQRFLLLISPHFYSRSQKQRLSSCYCGFNSIYDIFGFTYPNARGLIRSNVPATLPHDKRSEKRTRHFFRFRVGPCRPIRASTGRRLPIYPSRRARSRPKFFFSARFTFPQDNAAPRARRQGPQRVHRSMFGDTKNRARR